MQLHVHAPVEVAAARNAARAGHARVPEAVFARLAAAWESPRVSKHAFEQATVDVDMSDEGQQGTGDANSIWRQLTALWATAGPATRSGPTAEEQHLARQVGQAGNAASDVHAWDVRARAAVSSAVASGASFMHALHSWEGVCHNGASRAHVADRVRRAPQHPHHREQRWLARPRTSGRRAWRRFVRRRRVHMPTWMLRARRSCWR